MSEATADDRLARLERLVAALAVDHFEAGPGLNRMDDAKRLRVLADILAIQRESEQPPMETRVG
jgi:hypothetical protein